MGAALTTTTFPATTELGSSRPTRWTTSPGSRDLPAPALVARSSRRKAGSTGRWWTPRRSAGSTRASSIAFRFTCCESLDALRHARSGCRTRARRGTTSPPGKGVDREGPFWEPDYDDPVFLEKLDRFLAAAAARYDGNPEVAFIDVGSFGVWGEGHTFASTQLKYPAEVVKKHIDLHAEALQADAAGGERRLQLPGPRRRSVRPRQGHDAAGRQHPRAAAAELLLPRRHGPAVLARLPGDPRAEHYGPSKSAGPGATDRCT